MNPTKEQQAIIDSLRCERLSSDRNNLRLVGSFYNRRNNSLADILQNEAYEEDIDKGPRSQSLFILLTL